MNERFFDKHFWQMFATTGTSFAVWGTNLDLALKIAIGLVTLIFISLKTYRYWKRGGETQVWRKRS